MLRRRWFDLPALKQLRRMERLRVPLTLMMVLLAISTATAQEQHATKTDPWGLVDFSGTVGTSRVGMLFDLGKATAVPAHFSASYFYTRHLTDIPLEGALDQSGGYTLLENDETGKPRATFALFPTGNDGKRVADLYVATGLTGTWKSADGTSLPVKLSLTDSLPGATAATRYGKDTGASAKIEGTARRFLAAVASDDRKAAAREISFPLRANVAKSQIKDSAELDARWTSIFTPSYVACLKSLVPHNMFTNGQGSMMGDGAVWLDSSGVIALNTCDPQASLR